jgi:hypothetical protein
LVARTLVVVAEGSGSQSGAVAAVAFEEQCGDASGRISFITGGKSFI